MTQRIFNFSAGPAVMPLPVLEQAQRELVSLPGVGMSVMEISHRSKTFEDLLNGAIADIRELAGVPATYRTAMPAAPTSGPSVDRTGTDSRAVCAGTQSPPVSPHPGRVAAAQRLRSPGPHRRLRRPGSAVKAAADRGRP